MWTSSQLTPLCVVVTFIYWGKSSEHQALLQGAEQLVCCQTIP